MISVLAEGLVDIYISLQPAKELWDALEAKYGVFYAGSELYIMTLSWFLSRCLGALASGWKFNRGVTVTMTPSLWHPELSPRWVWHHFSAGWTPHERFGVRVGKGT